MRFQPGARLGAYEIRSVLGAFNPVLSIDGKKLLYLVRTSTGTRLRMEACGQSIWNKVNASVPIFRWSISLSGAITT